MSRRLSGRCWSSLLACLLLLSVGLSSAAAAEPESTDKMPKTFVELITAGGPLNIAFISVLGLFSLFGMAIILERLANLREKKVIPPDFVHGLQLLVGREEDNPRPFAELCARYPSVIANILKAGLLRAGRPVLEVEKAMEDAAARELGALRSRVRPLTVLSAVGPLVGLLGTAVGMIMVFRTASQHGLLKPELLAEGIYLKLETTVAGLIVAIPSVIFAAVLNSRSEKLMRRIDEHLMEIIPCFARMEFSEVSQERVAQHAPAKLR